MKLLTSLMLILLAAMAAFAQKEAPTKDVTFKDAKNRFSVTYPPDWQSVPPDAEFQLKLTKGFSPHRLHTSEIVVGVTFVEANKNNPREKFIEDLAKNLDQIEAAFRQQSASAKIVANGRTRLAGRDAFFIQTEYANPIEGSADGKIIFRTVFTRESGDDYTVSFLATEHTFKQAFSEFERIISTFTID